MVNAGRVLIIAKGEWSNLVNYSQLDLVSYNQVAYLARQASVGVNPSTDTDMTYWQPFGSVSDIATTTQPGLVMPDGQTITIDDTGLITASVGVEDIADIIITSPSNGQILVYNSSTQKWVNGSLSASSASYSNGDSGLAATNVQAAIDELADEKQDALTFDAAPASGSSNPVTSAGIYTNTVGAVTGSSGTSDGQVKISVTKSGTASNTNMTVTGWDKLVGKWTTTVSSAVGATSASFTNPQNSTNVAIDPFAQTSSGKPVGYNTMTVTASTITLAFDALEEATSFKLLVKKLG